MNTKPKDGGPTDQEINISIAESRGQKLFVLHKLIHDPFGYYRENAHGYTSNIGEAWKVTDDVARKYTSGRKTDPDRVIAEPAPTPDYCHDLNAMHEAWLILDANRRCQFSEHLHNIVVHSLHAANESDIAYVVSIEGLAENATARQRAEAFLRTVGKWKEGK